VARGQTCLDVGDAVGAVEQAAEREATDRRTAVALALVGDQAAAAKRAIEGAISLPLTIW
jgi:hypothetical protein